MIAAKSGSALTAELGPAWPDLDGNVWRADRLNGICKSLSGFGKMLVHFLESNIDDLSPQ